MQHSESTEVAESVDVPPTAGLELEARAISVDLQERWLDRGQQFTSWVLEDLPKINRIGEIQGLLFPDQDEAHRIYLFLTEQAYYSPSIAKLLIVFREVAKELPEGYRPSLNPHTLDILVKIPAQFLGPVLRREERYMGLAFDEMPHTAKGADSPSLTKFVKQLQDRVDYQNKPQARLAERSGTDSEDALMREEMEAVDQPRLIEDAAPTPAASFAPTAITNGSTLIQHLRPVWKAWPVIQKSVIDDICEGRVSREDTVEACDIGLKLFKALKQYAQQAQ